MLALKENINFEIYLDTIKNNSTLCRPLKFSIALWSIFSILNAFPLPFKASLRPLMTLCCFQQFSIAV